MSAVDVPPDLLDDARRKLLEERAAKATRDSIARYLEHCARAQIGIIDLGWMTWRELLEAAASWTRNELDVQWAREVAAHAAPQASEGSEKK